jgi:DNA primase
MVNVLDIVADTRRAGATNGGEYSSPCPWCGGTDRFRLWPEHPSGRSRFWCRRCARSGDEIDLLRELRGMSFQEAAVAIGQAEPSRGRGSSRKQNDSVTAPCASWQGRAAKVAEAAEQVLWQSEGKRAVTYLKGRGFAEQTLRAARLGYTTADRHEEPNVWGLPVDHKGIWIPRGVTIPWRACGSLWRLNVRRPAGKPKYCGPAGSGNALYGADGLRGNKPAMLVEGEFDALAVAQEAGDLVVAVATGSTHGARQATWRRMLASRPLVIVAFDADAAGEDATEWWLDRLSNAQRLAPERDPAAMLEAGKDLRHWVQSGSVR